MSDADVDLDAEPEVERRDQDLLVRNGREVDYKLTVDKLVEAVADLKHERAQLYDQIDDLEREKQILHSRLDGLVSAQETHRRLWAALLDVDEDATNDDLEAAAVARRRAVRTEAVDERVDSKVEACRTVAAAALERMAQNGRTPVLESVELVDRVESRHGFAPDPNTVRTALKDVADANEDVEYVAGTRGPGVPYNRIRLITSESSETS